ncbi:MAG: T9SS type A sorting domain-containing protein [Bacteroidetes bacterium]|nr:T9SS type A sorting domain-containing protein [Bacteroidota bacterium]
MKKYNFPKLALLFAGLSFFLAFSASAQVSNLNINYEVQNDVIYINNDWNPVGAEQNSVLIDVYDNGWTGEHCFTYSMDGEGYFYESDESLHVGLNRPYYTPLYFDLRGWGNAVGSVCTPDFGDINEIYAVSDSDGLQDKFYLHDVGPSGQWSDNWSNQVNEWIFNSWEYDMRLKSVWRYAGGDSFANALDFGTIGGSDIVTHYNSNRGAPSGATSPHVGYPDNYQESSSEVIYKFTVNTTSFIEITTDDPATNYDTYIYLYDEDYSVVTESNNISSSNLKSNILGYVCPGTYYVMVEGNQSSEGDFQLYISRLGDGDLDVSLDYGDASCPGSSDGFVSVDVHFGLYPVQYSWQDGSTSSSLENVGPGAYSVYVTDGCGQTVFLDIILGIDDSQPPTALCQDLNYTLEPGQTASFSANDIDNGSYDNCEIQDLSININQVSYDMPGANTVTLTAYDDSGNQSSCTATVTVTQSGGTSGVRDLKKEIAINLSPNPATDVVLVSFNKDELSDQAQLSIRDLMGRTLWTGPALNGDVSIPLDNMAAGLYLVVLQDENYTGTKRLVIQ